MKFLDKIFGNAIKSDKAALDIINQNQTTRTVDNIPLSEKYPGMDEEDLYWLLENKENNDEELTNEEKKFLEDEGWAQFGRTLHREHLYGRSLAVRELINNNYLTLPDEHGNPFKELINFTLQYFEKYIKDKPVEAENQLRSAFPLMNEFIHRQISKEQNSISIENNFDEQQAYDEFLDFCKTLLCSLHPKKKERDLQIKRLFKIFHNDLIQFIGAEHEN
jgi:hypothetical protein